jgi:hypothetical protein
MPDYFFLSPEQLAFHITGLKNYPWFWSEEWNGFLAPVSTDLLCALLDSGCPVEGVADQLFLVAQSVVTEHDS